MCAKLKTHIHSVFYNMKALTAAFIFLVGVIAKSIANLEPSFTQMVESRDLQVQCIKANEYFVGNPTMDNPATFDFRGPKSPTTCYWAFEVPANTRVHYRIDQIEYCGRCANFYLYNYEKGHFDQKNMLVSVSERVTNEPKMGVLEGTSSESYVRGVILVRRKIKASQGIKLSLYFEGSSNIPESTTDSAIEAANDSCGVAPKETRIVGGVEASPNEFGFLAGLALKTSGKPKPFCGASIISKNFILTAAHCSAFQPFQLQAVIGAHNWNEDTNIQLINIQEIIRHSGYNTQTLMNDIALMKLSSNIRVGSSAFPVCLSNLAPTVYPSATVIGWGLTDENSFTQPTKVRKVDVPVISNNDCKSAYGSLMRSSMFCAGFEEGQKDSCQGDSGGPLFQRDSEDRFTLIGVVSWGFGCARPNNPGVYTDVHQFKQWISDNCSTC